MSTSSSRLRRPAPDVTCRWAGLEHSDAAVVVDAVVTGRHGGVSRGSYASLNLGLHVGDDPAAVIENRTRAAATVRLGLDDLVFARQTHGSRVTMVGPGDRGRGSRSDDDAIADTDALVTTEPDVGLVVLVADCLPIVLVDPAARVLAVVHAGWRGTVARVAAAAVDVMGSLGAEPSRIIAGLGPAVAAGDYQVGPEVADAAVAAFGAEVAEPVIRPDGTGRFTFDLIGANRRVLAQAGLDAGSIHWLEATTGGDAFFSDRAERPCGRFAAIARLRR